MRDRNPQAANQTRQRFDRAFSQISANPLLGRIQDEDGVRKKVMLPGGYLIYYVTNDADRSMTIIGISHPAQRRPYEDA